MRPCRFTFGPPSRPLSRSGRGRHRCRIGPELQRLPKRMVAPSRRGRDPGAAIHRRPPSAFDTRLERGRRSPIRASCVRRESRVAHASRLRHLPNVQLRAARTARERDVLPLQGLQRLRRRRRHHRRHRRVVQVRGAPGPAARGREGRPRVELPVLARPQLRLVREHPVAVREHAGRDAHERDPVRLQHDAQHAAAGRELHVLRGGGGALARHEPRLDQHGGVRGARARW